LVSPEDKIFTELYNYIYFLQSFRDALNNALTLQQPYNINSSD
jgi:hypothetical protein